MKWNKLVFHCVIIALLHDSVIANDVVEVSFDPSVHWNTTINPRFASYSMEYGSLPAMTGTFPNLTAPFFQLMNNIKAYTGAAPQFRIGGNSADWSWWNPDNLTSPSKLIWNNILPAEILTIQAVTEKLDTVATLSVNFVFPTNVSLAVSFMQAVKSLINFDNIYAIEIGNEVDLYQSNGIRPKDNWTYDEYQSQFELYYNSILPYFSESKYIQGATYCCEHEFLIPIPQYLTAEQSKLKTISLHEYPTSHCGDQFVSLSEILTDSASIGRANRYAEYVTESNAKGIDFWVGELNSAACGGAPNVSNVFGACLWAVDILFAYANVSVKGVNFHTGYGTYYASFEYLKNGTLEIKPLYYAQLFFAQAIRANSALVTSVHIVNTTNPLVKVWAVYDNDNQDVRIVAIHKDLNSTVPATVTVTLTQGSYNINADLLLFTAPSPYSTNGIQIGGQTFDNSQTGFPIGNQVTSTVIGAKNSYSFSLSPTSIAMLTIHPN